jgi:hypothetical protein
MRAIGAVLARLTTIGVIPDCQRCGEPMLVVSEERLVLVPPVFDVRCQCSGCGVAMRVRQVLPHFE